MKTQVKKIPERIPVRKSPTKAYAQRQDYLVLQDFKGYNRIDHYEKQSKVCEGNFMQNEVEVTVCPSFLSRNELCLNTQNEIDWSSEHSNLPEVERNQLQSTSNVEDVVSIEESSDTVYDSENIQSITNKASRTSYMQPY